MLRNSIINLVLKCGLAISFLYSTLAAFIVPANVVSRWPSFLANNLSEQTLAIFTGICSLFLIAWLFSRQHKFTCALTITILIGLAALFNIRDVSYLFYLAPLFSIALSLTLRYYPRIRVIARTHLTPLSEDSESELYSDEREGRIIDADTRR